MKIFILCLEHLVWGWLKGECFFFNYDGSDLSFTCEFVHTDGKIFQIIIIADVSIQNL